MSRDLSLNLVQRPRRLRRNSSIRDLVRETVVRPENLIAPLFVKEGTGAPEPIESMPGIQRYSLSDLVRECSSLQRLGLRAVALFPCLPSSVKDASGTAALSPETLILRVVRQVKKELPDLTVMTDVALDPYTTHGHDGLWDPAIEDVDNDRTVTVLQQMAVLHAEAGTDWVAPSDMMDGRVGAIRHALDQAGYTRTGIMAYSIKFASAYYGPFRDAVGSAQAAGTASLDKRTYQLDPANRRAAMIEAALDEQEGADILMVKPAGPYLDIIRELRDRTELPIAAYQVSGEYAQIHAAAQRGWLDLAKTRDESLLAIRRAGADMILTYFAKDLLNSGMA
jgi:porphobilinogen synthase